MSSLYRNGFLLISGVTSENGYNVLEHFVEKRGFQPEVSTGLYFMWNILQHWKMARCCIQCCYAPRRVPCWLNVTKKNQNVCLQRCYIIILKSLDYPTEKATAVAFGPVSSVTQFLTQRTHTQKQIQHKSKLNIKTLQFSSRTASQQPSHNTLQPDA